MSIYGYEATLLNLAKEASLLTRSLLSFIAQKNKLESNNANLSYNRIIQERPRSKQSTVVLIPCQVSLNRHKNTACYLKIAGLKQTLFVPKRPRVVNLTWHLNNKKPVSGKLTNWVWPIRQEFCQNVASKLR